MGIGEEFPCKLVYRPGGAEVVVSALLAIALAALLRSEGYQSDA